MLHANLVILGTPPNALGLQVDVGPAQPTNSTDAVTGLVREHERQFQARIDTRRDLAKLLILLFANERSPRVLLFGHWQPFQRIAFDKATTATVAGQSG